MGFNPLCDHLKFPRKSCDAEKGVAVAAALLRR